MRGYNKLRKRVLTILKTALSDKLYYHGIHHTLDALKVCERYLKVANITGEDAKLLRIGILLHDIGFTVSTKDHENHSVIIAQKLMTECGFSSAHLKIVKGLILATKIPQKPNNKLEKIIGDVDLDYLGGTNFYEIGHNLYKELKEYTTISNPKEWDAVQIKFLQNHSYHTNFAIKNRKPEKEKRLAELESKLTID